MLALGLGEATREAMTAVLILGHSTQGNIANLQPDVLSLRSLPMITHGLRTHKRNYRNATSLGM